MGSRTLRALTLAWMVFQVVALPVLLVADCCAPFREARETKPSCHQAEATPHCPMRTARGAMCPMHRPGPGEAHESRAACAMRGTCQGPAAAFLALLTNHGVLTGAPSTSPDFQAAEIAPPASSIPTERPAPADPPPPRA